MTDTKDAKFRQIGARVIDPRQSLFNSGRKERAQIVRLWCALDGECPLLNNKQCIHDRLFKVCIYGRMTVQFGPTPRARSYGDFIRLGENESEHFPQISGAPDHLAYIGDYVWLPYRFMSNDDGGFIAPPSNDGAHRNDKLPFIRRSAFLVHGIEFIKREDFTPELVCRIARWRPRALLDGEIAEYREKEVPRFLRDLRAYDRALYDRAVAMWPRIAELTASNRALIGEKAKIGDLPSGKVKYNDCVWSWNSAERSMETGEEQPLLPRGARVVIYPQDDLKVELCDPDMVDSLPDTVVVD